MTSEDCVSQPWVLNQTCSRYLSLVNLRLQSSFFSQALSLKVLNGNFLVNTDVLVFQLSTQLNQQEDLIWVLNIYNF